MWCSNSHVIHNYEKMAEFLYNTAIYINIFVSFYNAAIPYCNLCCLYACLCMLIACVCFFNCIFPLFMLLSKLIFRWIKLIIIQSYRAANQQQEHNIGLMQSSKLFINVYFCDFLLHALVTGAVDSNFNVFHIKKYTAKNVILLFWLYLSQVLTDLQFFYSWQEHKICYKKQ